MRNGDKALPSINLAGQAFSENAKKLLDRMVYFDKMVYAFILLS